jgi:hypothetical protein
MRSFLIIFLLLFSSNTYSQPLEETLEEVQLFFGGITELECCYIIKERTRAPFQGFLLSPYQLVLIKDTLDTWEIDLNKQLALSDQLCLDKISLCQDTRDRLVDDLKEEAIFYSDLSEKLTLNLSETKSDFKVFKIITYITIPIAVGLGAYVGYKL